MRTNRCVEPEVLDGLAAEDPRALRSRRDLQRVHRAMRSVTILRCAVGELRLTEPPIRILELGAGDGTLLLRFARAVRPRWPGVQLTLLDRIDVLSEQTRAGFTELGWRVEVMQTDALDWAATLPGEAYDLCIANLFLHHFDPPALDALLRAVAARAGAFVACEPHRSRLAALGSRLVGLLGANEVTREDAVKSVAAGFKDRELSAACDRAGWAGDAWGIAEFSSWPFTHCLAAARLRRRGPHAL